MNQNQITQMKVVRDCKALNDIHELFITELKRNDSNDNEVGFITVIDRSIESECLGHKIKVNVKPVATKGTVAALEYDFSVNWNNIDNTIYLLYLHENGTLTKDIEGIKTFHGFNNKYIKVHILADICSALVSSVVFKPGTITDSHLPNTQPAG